MYKLRYNQLIDTVLKIFVYLFKTWTKIIKLREVKSCLYRYIPCKKCAEVHDVRQKGSFWIY